MSKCASALHHCHTSITAQAQRPNGIQQFRNVHRTDVRSMAVGHQVHRTDARSMAVGHQVRRTDARIMAVGHQTLRAY